MMELQAIDAIDAVVLAPVLTGAVRARHHQPMQNRQEHRTLHGELEAAPDQHLLHRATAAALDPQTLEQQRSPDATAGKLRHPVIAEQRQNHRALRQPGGRARQAIKTAACLDIFRASETVDDALLRLAVLANSLDQIQIAIGTDSLLAHEHGVSIHSRLLSWDQRIQDESVKDGPERAKVVDFVKPDYYAAGYNLMVPKALEITSW